MGLGIFQVFDEARELKTKKTQKQTGPLRINLEIAGEPITIDAPDTERVEEILKLVQSLHDSNPSIVEVKTDAATEAPQKSEVEER